MKGDHGARICATLALPKVEMLRTGFLDALDQGADLIEIRIDHLDKPASINELELPDEAGISTIATIRKESDGGKFDGPEEFRWRVLQSAAEKFEYIDLEYGFANRERVETLRRAGAGVIVSHHDLNRTPPRDDLLSILNKARETGGDILKIATLVASSRDVLNLLTLPLEISPIIIIPMGEKGKTGRILAPLLGSEFAYAKLDGLPPVAPGMLSVREMRQVYDIIDEIAG